ncbi:MAG: DUF3604 domain-containing protein [Armatimonadota bacterium]|nr:DUF3604 domain-containing protein [Armatimonadota bacterium]
MVSMNRRDFLKGATAAGMAVLLTSPALSKTPDGAGTVELIYKKKPVVSQPWKADLVYTVGERGMADGGGFKFHTPVQSWDEPKITAKSVRFEPKSNAKAETSIESNGVLGWFVTVKVIGGSLKPGDKIIYTYDTAAVQKYSQTGMVCPHKIQSDIDGDGNFAKLQDSELLPIDILSRDAAHLRIVAQQTARPGQEIKVRSIVLDDFNNPVDKEYKKAIKIGFPGKEVERKYTGNRAEFALQAPNEPGIYFIHGTGPGLKEAYLPIRVSNDNKLNIYWGQLHGHTKESDGVDTIEDYYAYGRDIGFLDVCAGNDHAEGIHRNNSWAREIAAVKSFYKPGEFVTLAGYEWTTAGHRNVYFAEVSDDLPLLPATVKGSETYQEFIGKLKESGKEVIIGYHTAHPVDLSNYDPDIHRLEETHSMWGTSEYPGNPGWTKLGDNFIPQASAQTALARGQKFGIVGGGDNHHGRPGRYWYGSRWGIFGHKEGAAAILAPKLERREVFDALKNRHCYGTTGERILVMLEINGHHMGDEFETSEPLSIHLEAAGTRVLTQVELLRDNQVIWAKWLYEKSFTADIQDAQAPQGQHWYYLRVTQQHGDDRAWSSPIWVTRK